MLGPIKGEEVQNVGRQYLGLVQLPHFPNLGKFWRFRAIHAMFTADYCVIRMHACIFLMLIKLSVDYQWQYPLERHRKVPVCKNRVFSF